MTSPLNKLKKIRSWDEIRTRGGQAVSAYGEKLGLRERIPTDTEFERLIDKDQLGGAPLDAESLMQEFYLNAESRFFPSFRHDLGGVEKFQASFPKAVDGFVEEANGICEGRINLLGFKNLDIGKDVEWHVEPVSRIQSPMKHWKEFDEMDTRESGDKKIIWELNRHQHFFTLGAAYWLTGEAKFAETFASHLDSWMEQNPPGMGLNWCSSMEVAFRAISWIWALQFFRDSAALSPELFLKAIKYLYFHGRHIEKYLSRYYSPNTHLTGEALGLYYLGTQLHFLQRSSHWRKVGDEIFFTEVERQLHDDGVYFEQSTWYQRYTVDFYTQFVVLKSLGNIEVDGTPVDAIEKRLGSALEFLMHMTRPDGLTPMIGDDDGGCALPMTSDATSDFRGTLTAGADLLGRGDLKYISSHNRERSFWLYGPDRRSQVRIETQEPDEASAQFPSGGYFVMRDGWLDTDNFLVIDCGPVGALTGGHGHADALAIEVALHGKTLLVDPGTGSYHESADIRNAFRSTGAHNTLVIDGQSSSEPGGTFSWRSRAESKVNNWISDSRFDFFSGEHDGYRRLEGQPVHERSILFLKNDYVVIRDVVRTHGEHDYSLNFHFDRGLQAVIDPEGKFVSGDNWRMFVFDNGGHWQKQEGWVSKKYGSREAAPFLQFLSRGHGKQEFFTFILPDGDTGSKPQIKEVPIDSARAFVITYRDYTDFLIVSDDPQTTIRTELADTDFEFTWARIGSRADAPEEFVLVNGSQFAIGGHEVLNHMGGLGYATIRQVGSDLNVNTPNGRFRVTLPK